MSVMLIRGDATALTASTVRAHPFSNSRESQDWMDRKLRERERERAGSDRDRRSGGAMKTNRMESDCATACLESEIVKRTS